VSDQRRATGICWTCCHDGGCSLTSDRDRPVLDCDEFETEPGPPGPGRVGRDEPSGGEDGDPPGSARFRGLCANCARRDTCTFDKPEGGVWFCEEYE